MIKTNFTASPLHAGPVGLRLEPLEATPSHATVSIVSGTASDQKYNEYHQTRKRIVYSINAQMLFTEPALPVQPYVIASITLASIFEPPGLGAMNQCLGLRVRN